MNKFAMTIDWEDFGQLLCRDKYGSITTPVKNIIDRQTNIILELLDKNNVKATFFILGMLAKEKPNLVKKIDALGHEIALHGNMHINLKSLSKIQFQEDISTSHKIVTDIIGKPVFGFRAPYFSIVKQNIDFLETIAALGLLYDSSIFPIPLKRYGIKNFPATDTHIALNNNMNMVELPITCAPLYSKTIPVAGGGYMRALPQWALNKLITLQKEKYDNVMLYMHPYEFDSKWLDCKTNYPSNAQYTSIKTTLVNIRWNIFRGSIIKKLEVILRENTFSTCHEKAIKVKQQTAIPINDILI